MQLRICFSIRNQVSEWNHQGPIVRCLNFVRKNTAEKKTALIKKKEKNSQCLPTLVTFLPVCSGGFYLFLHQVTIGFLIPPPLWEDPERWIWQNHWTLRKRGVRGSSLSRFGDLQTNGFWDPMILRATPIFLTFYCGDSPLWQSTFRAWCPKHDVHHTPILWICFQETWVVGPFWLQIRPTKK